MPKRSITIELTACSGKTMNCPYYEEEDIDEYHGSAYTPDRCRKARRAFRDTDNPGEEIPIWCPFWHHGRVAHIKG